MQELFFPCWQVGLAFSYQLSISETLLSYLVRKRHIIFRNYASVKMDLKGRTLINVYEIYIELDRQRFILWKSILNSPRSRVNWLQSAFSYVKAGTKKAGTISAMLTSLG